MNILSILIAQSESLKSTCSKRGEVERRNLAAKDKRSEQQLKQYGRLQLAMQAKVRMLVEELGQARLSEAAASRR